MPGDARVGDAQSGDAQSGDAQVGATRSGDLRVIVDPDTYTRGVPHHALTRLRDVGVVRDGGTVSVFRHADVRTVLRTPKVFSSWLGGTQLRDPATPRDLDYVRRMMLNTDPPDHTRLRGLLTRAFTPRAVADLETKIGQWANDLVAPLAGGEPVDFAEVVADLPLLTLAEVFGVPHRDRALMFDWSNRVIGYQDPDYAHSTSDTTGMSDMALRALELRPDPQPDPRARGGMPDLYAYAHALGEHKRREPGDDVMSNLMRHDVAVEEFETLFWLFSVAGNETLRNGIPGGLIALMHHPDQYEHLKRDRSALPRGGGDAALVDAGHALPAHRHHRHRTRRRPDHPRRQGRRLVHRRQPRPPRLPRPGPLRRHPRPGRAPLVRPRPALLPGRPPGPRPTARPVHRRPRPPRPAHPDRPPDPPSLELPERGQEPPGPAPTRLVTDTEMV
ncbi:Cytochrome P450 family protein [Saccharothrix espanaensis DSM 44229]|uniref:Cytochrome P450 family protein n=1 Tax=Saccharothrix espanaensis (strain ATCC 51144 / DSM 44229 / JCM 9112 / NBRC 15066 / NRRL 15764) TaxID=1179773 RepID=K0JV56_SACES|nr:Cytochrome P450 family protein [Saccharothrix espanaensis DSM 44229]